MKATSSFVLNISISTPRVPNTAPYWERRCSRHLLSLLLPRVECRVQRYIVHAAYRIGFPTDNHSPHGQAMPTTEARQLAVYGQSFASSSSTSLSSSLPFSPLPSSFSSSLSCSSGVHPLSTFGNGGSNLNLPTQTTKASPDSSHTPKRMSPSCARADST